jgi:hypothetical protein
MDLDTQCHWKGSAMIASKTPGHRRGLGIWLCLAVVVLTPVLAAAQPTEEEGTATFYSSKFEGKKTASGAGDANAGHTAAPQT